MTKTSSEDDKPCLARVDGDHGGWCVLSPGHTGPHAGIRSNATKCQCSYCTRPHPHPDTKFNPPKKARKP